MEFSSVTGETRMESPKRNWRSIGYVAGSLGYWNQRGWRTGVPSLLAWWKAV